MIQSEQLSFDTGMSLHSGVSVTKLSCLIEQCLGSGSLGLGQLYGSHLSIADGHPAVLASYSSSSKSSQLSRAAVT